MNFDIKIELLTAKEINDSLYTGYFAEYTHLLYPDPIKTIPDLYSFTDHISWCGLFTSTGYRGRCENPFLWTQDDTEADCPECLARYVIRTLAVLP